MFNKEEIKIANATNRSNGAIGPNAVVLKKLKQIFREYGYDKSTTTILDFGAGKHALHARELISNGWSVTAHEFGDNFDPTIHSEDALSKQYDIIYASNVLNVQCSKSMLIKTITQISSVMKPNGMFVANYPKSPRKNNLKPSEIESILIGYFDAIYTTTNYSKSSFVWICEGYVV